MVQDMKKEVKDWEDEDEVRDYLKKLLHKEAFDRRGLIYGKMCIRDRSLSVI